MLNMNPVLLGGKTAIVTGAAGYFGRSFSECLLLNGSKVVLFDKDKKVIDLAKALKEEIISGAGLDVYKNEPYNGVLSSFENVVTTPHIGAYAMEIRNVMEFEAVENLIKGLANE